MSNSSPKLLDQVRDVMRRNHYSIHTERSYIGWIKQYIGFHKMQNRDDLKRGEAKIEAFLTHLAVNRNVAPNTQSQALNALVFLYKRVLEIELKDKIDAARAKKKTRIPEVLSVAEVENVFSKMIAGTAFLVTQIMYGSGLRIQKLSV